MSPSRAYGWKPDAPDHRDQLLKASFIDSLLLPRQKDLRPWCSRVEDQGALGSCTANSSTSAVEYLYRKLGRPTQPELSRLFLYYATRVWTEKTPAGQDNGAQIRDVMKTLALFGVCLEKSWPYDVTKFSVPPIPTAKLEALQHQILYYFSCPTLTSIKKSIADGYPCVGGFSVPSNMESDECAATGIVKYPGPREGFIGGHAVLFVGYDNKTQLLTFQNSWGTGWGDKGFGYLPYAFVSNGLADDFWTVRVTEF